MKQWIVALFITCLTGTLCAQKLLEIQPGFDLSTNDILSEIDLENEDLGTWNVYVKNVELTDQTSSVVIDNLEEEEVSFELEESYTMPDGSLIWRGISSHSEFPDGKVYLVVTDGIMGGSVWFSEDDLMGIKDVGDNTFVLFRKEVDPEHTCDTDHYPFRASASVENSTESQGTSCNGIQVFRVIIAYSQEFAASFIAPGVSQQNEINEFLENVINSVNNTYISSGLNVRARLAFSYETDNEYGNKDDDFAAFVSPLNQKYNEVFAYRQQYNAEVAILLVNANIGGRASRGGNMGIYGKNGAINFGVAHEIGHMFDLDHNREEYSYWERKINGLGWAKDNKKAYGYRNSNYRTTMSYGSMTRVGLHSDPSLTFPNSSAAGNQWAKARNFLAGHLSNVLSYSDPQQLFLTDQIETKEMASYFAFQDIYAANFTVEGAAWSNLRAQDEIVLFPGTDLQYGTTVNIEIIDCSQRFGFKNETGDFTSEEGNDGLSAFIAGNQSSFIIYPNPTDDRLNIQFQESIPERIHLMDMSGRTVTVKYPTEVFVEMDVSSVTPGIYFVKVQYADGKSETEKLLVR